MDLTYIVQVSTDLTHWTDGLTYPPGGTALPDPSMTEIDRSTTAPGMESITVEDKTAGEGVLMRFMRLVVLQGP
jgi:hypothetical protein